MEHLMEEDFFSSLKGEIMHSDFITKGKDTWNLAVTSSHLLLNHNQVTEKHEWDSILGATISNSKKKHKRVLTLFLFPLQNNTRRLTKLKFSAQNPEELYKIIQSMSYHRKMPEPYESSYKKRFKIIINPNSGRGLARRVWSQVSELFKVCEVSVSYTERRNHATEIVTELNLADFDGLIVISGDGLVHEVINALCKREDADIARLFPVGVIPAGSANALAQVVCFRSGEEVNIQNSAYICIKGKPQPYDISLVKFESGLEIFSFLCVFWAFIGDVDIESERCRCCGSCRFDMYGFWRVLFLRRYSGTIKWDDGEYSGPIIYFMACNAPFIGEGMHVAPKSKIHDGVNDLLFLGNVGRMPLVRVLLRQDAGTHLNVPQLQYIKSAKWSLRPDNKRGIFSIDGERFDVDNIEVEVLKEYGTIIFL